MEELQLFIVICALFTIRKKTVKRVEGHALIPASNEALQVLAQLNTELIFAAHQQHQGAIVTLDQDATLIETYNNNALYCYEGYKAYQPFNYKKAWYWQIDSR